MPGTDTFTPRFVDSFPSALSTGVFYISVEFNSCAHLCACGCGHEVITPLSPAQWSFRYDGQSISVWPSVGNWTLPCQSHYVIDDGQVRWARQFTPAEIARNRARDRRALEREGADDASTPVRVVDGGQRGRGSTVGTAWRRFRDTLRRWRPRW